MRALVCLALAGVLIGSECLAQESVPHDVTVNGSLAFIDDTWCARVQPVSVTESQVFPPELFPRRDDYAWEGVIVGAGLGLAFGIFAISTFPEGDASTVGVIGFTLASTALGGTVGLLVGGLFPKAPADSANADPDGGHATP